MSNMRSPVISVINLTDVDLVIKIRGKYGVLPALTVLTVRRGLKVRDVKPASPYGARIGLVCPGNGHVKRELMDDGRIASWK